MEGGRGSYGWRVWREKGGGFGVPSRWGYRVHRGIWGNHDTDESQVSGREEKEEEEEKGGGKKRRRRGRKKEGEGGTVYTSSFLPKKNLQWNVELSSCMEKHG